MKKDKNIQPEQSSVDNGWKPRMKAVKEGDKDFVLDLQTELLLKSYPTRESRAKEHEESTSGYNPFAQNASGNFGATRDDYEEDAIETQQVPSSYMQSNYVEKTKDGNAGEVYTRLAKPKEKTGFEDRAKHVYRKMPGSENAPEQPVAAPTRPQGLGRAYETEDMLPPITKPAAPEVKAQPETSAKPNVLEALDRLFANTDVSAGPEYDKEEYEPQQPQTEVSYQDDSMPEYAEPKYEESDYEEPEASDEEYEEELSGEAAAEPSSEAFEPDAYEEEPEEEPAPAPQVKPAEEKKPLFNLPFEIQAIEPGTLEARQASLNTTKPPKADPFDMPPIRFSKGPVELPEWAKKQKEEEERLAKEALEREQAQRELAMAEAKARAEAEARADEEERARKASAAYRAISQKIDQELNGTKAVSEEEALAQKKREMELDKELDRLSSSSMLDDIFGGFAAKSKKKRRNLLDDMDDLEDEIDAKLATLTGSGRRTPISQQSKIGVNTGFSVSDLTFGGQKPTSQSEAAQLRQRRIEAARQADEARRAEAIAAARNAQPQGPKLDLSGLGQTAPAATPQPSKPEPEKPQTVAPKAEAAKPEAKQPEAKADNTENTKTDLSKVASAVQSALQETPSPRKQRPSSLAAAMEEEAPTPKKKNQEKTFSRLMKLLKPYTPWMLLSLLVTLISVGLQLYMPFLTGKIIDNAVGTGLVQMSVISKLLLQMLVVILVTVVTTWIMEIVNNRITFGVIRDIRVKAFNHMLELPLKYIDSKKQGELINCVMTDVDQISDGLLLGFSQIFSGIITIVGTLVFMVLVDWRVAIAVVVLTPLSLVVASQIAKRTYHMFQKQSANRAELASHIEEMISNQKVVIAFGREANSIEVFDDLNTEFSKSSRKATFFSSITNPSTRFVNSVVYAVVGALGAVFGIQGSMTIGDISCFLSYARQYTKPFNEISGVIAEFQNALASAARVFDLLDEEAEKDETGASNGKGATGAVELNHVKFSYDPKKRLITDFNLNVTPGQRVAIVGPTGCGKTTMINLLMRFYDINAGSIRIDQKDIQKMSRDDLRSNFGMVLQDTWIRSGTIEENIAIGNPNATHDQIVEAAKAVYAHGFIRRLPQGYQTVLAEGGEGLSQGQKQLLCIARVMLKRPSMLILDEATSSIDSRTEIMVQKAFDELMKGRTSFVVAHRLSTIREADVILVMKDGNIIEQGSHEELLSKGGFYYELFQSQYAH